MFFIRVKFGSGFLIYNWLKRHRFAGIFLFGPSAPSFPFITLILFSRGFYGYDILGKDELCLGYADMKGERGVACLSFFEILNLQFVF